MIFYALNIKVVESRMIVEAIVIQEAGLLIAEF